MLGTVVVDDSGWEPVGNVQFSTNSDRSSNGTFQTETVPPPPEFSEDSATSSFSTDEPDDVITTKKDASTHIELKNERPSRQYVYGVNKEASNKNVVVVKSSLKAPLKGTHENIIEADIRLQQKREEEMKKESEFRNREKNGGATSPSSHASDEGFVDRPIIEDIPSPQLSSSSLNERFTHTIKASNGDVVIYDAVSPPPIYFGDGSLNPSSSEAKIALEIRELKEREAELRNMREMREREHGMRVYQNNVKPTTTPISVQAVKAVNSSEKSRNVEFLYRESPEDHLTSITTSTDEGNYSECGDNASSEDKSSNESSSRMMSPDPHVGSFEIRHNKRVTVKPFEDDEEKDAAGPTYLAMRKESVIEREIRIAKEREEAYRREKGLLLPSPNSPQTTQSNHQQIASSKSLVNGISNGNVNELNANKSIDTISKSNLEDVEGKPDQRGVQRRLATSRIQQEIEENAMRERELIFAGKIKTLSEDTVDSKVTRLVDFTSGKVGLKTFSNPSTNSLPAISKPIQSQPEQEVNGSCIIKGHIPLSKKNSTPVLSICSQYPKVPTSPTVSNEPPFFNRLTRSLSTNNLAVFGSLASPSSMVNHQKGLMQKFIASRGKLTGTTFNSAGSSYRTANGYPTTSNGIPTRPMRLFAKGPNAHSPCEAKADIPKAYRKKPATAEEKIQEELADFKSREEELRRLRAKNLARSQPNLADMSEEADYDSLSSEGVDSSSFLHEMNSLKSALSNPNLLDDEAEHPNSHTQPTERGVRRRSALIAQWEGMIQKTAET